jgi:predicted SPOUT superfamily RNA methylase MTH1
MPLDSNGKPILLGRYSLSRPSLSKIGRALGVFCVDEVVIFNDGTVPTGDTGGISEPNAFLVHILQFLETPQ